MQKFTRSLFRQLKSSTFVKRELGVTSSSCNKEYILKSNISDIVIPKSSVTERLWKDCSKFNHVAIECAETGKKYTYPDLRKMSAAFATSLHKSLGLRVGDMVAVMIPNCPEFPVVAIGCMQAGCILTTTNPTYKEYELRHQISITQPKVIVTVADCYDILVEALNNAKWKAKIVLIDNANESIPCGTLRFSELAEKVQPDYKYLENIVRSEDDVVLVPFSSGTTGLPKGVEITNKNVLAALEVMTKDEFCYPLLTTDNYQDVVPCVLPFFHIYGLVVVLMGHLSRGCKLVTISKFSTNLFLSTMKEKKCSLLYVVPPLVLLLAKHPDVSYEHIKHVRKVVSGAAPLSASDVEPLYEKSKGNVEILQGYGATETTSLITSTVKGSCVDLSASGIPMSNNEIMFQDPASGAPVPIGQIGEILVKSPTVMKAYYKNENATKETFTSNGFFKTGDLGYYKPGQGLFICDRIKELIKVKGMQVAPAELESLIRNHPAVLDAAVIGIPHELFGEVPKAFVITKNGTTPTAEDIQNYVATRVATYKQISQVQFVKEIPKTASGKVLRKELKNMKA